MSRSTSIFEVEMRKEMGFRSSHVGSDAPASELSLTASDVSYDSFEPSNTKSDNLDQLREDNELYRIPWWFVSAIQDSDYKIVALRMQIITLRVQN